MANRNVQQAANVKGPDLPGITAFNRGGVRVVFFCVEAVSSYFAVAPAVLFSQRIGINPEKFGYSGQHFLLRHLHGEYDPGSFDAAVTVFHQHITNDAALLHDPAVFPATLLRHVSLQANAAVGAVQAAPEDGVAALIGLERLVVAGNDVGACFPGVFLCVLRPERGKRDIGRQVGGRIFTLVLTKQRFQLAVIHVSQLLFICERPPLNYEKRSSLFSGRLHQGLARTHDGTGYSHHPPVLGPWLACPHPIQQGAVPADGEPRPTAVYPPLQRIHCSALLRFLPKELFQRRHVAHILRQKGFIQIIVIVAVVEDLEQAGLVLVEVDALKQTAQLRHYGSLSGHDRAALFGKILMEPVLHQHLAVGEMGGVAVHALEYLKGFPPLAWAREKRVDPAHLRPALVDRTPPVLQKDTGMVIPHRVHQVDGQASLQKVNRSVAFIYVMDGVGPALRPENPGQVVGVRRLQHQITVQAAAAVPTTGAVEAHPVFGPDRFNGAHAAASFTLRTR